MPNTTPTAPTTTKAAKAVRWDRLHDVFRFRIHRHRRYAYWVRATDLAPDEIAATLEHLRAKSWWTATHERDLRRAVLRRRRDLRKPTMPKLHNSTEQRLVGLFRCGFRRWALAREFGLSVDEISLVLRKNGCTPRDRKKPAASRASR